MKFEEFYESMKKDKLFIPDSQRENEKYCIKDVYDAVGGENISKEEMELYKKIFNFGYRLGEDVRAEKDITIMLKGNK